MIATATPTIYGWLAKWNTTGVANATYTLQSVATSNGMTGTSNPITITVNNPPPSTQVLIPASGATLDSSQNMVFDAVASPGVTKVSIVVNVNGFPLTFASTPTIYGWIATVPGSQPCADCSAIPEPSTIESVAYLSRRSERDEPCSRIRHHHFLSGSRTLETSIPAMMPETLRGCT